MEKQAKCTLLEWTFFKLDEANSSVNHTLCVPSFAGKSRYFLSFGSIEHDHFLITLHEVEKVRETAF